MDTRSGAMRSNTITVTGKFLVALLCTTLFASGVWAKDSATTAGIKTGKDESLTITIHVSAKSPGKDKESNWLPAPDGPFWPVLRTYGPGKAIQDGSWKVPPIAKANWLPAPTRDSES